MEERERDAVDRDEMSEWRGGERSSGKEGRKQQQCPPDV